MQTVTDQARPQPSPLIDAFFLGFFESLFVWGIGFFWIYIAAWDGHSFWSALPLFFFGGLLLVQLLAGWVFWAIGNYHLHEPVNLSRYQWQPNSPSTADHPAHAEQMQSTITDDKKRLGQRHRHRGQVLVYSVMITMTIPPLLALFGIAMTMLNG